MSHIHEHLVLLHFRQKVSSSRRPEQTPGHHLDCGLNSFLHVSVSKAEAFLGLTLSVAHAALIGDSPVHFLTRGVELENHK